MGQNNYIQVLDGNRGPFVRQRSGQPFYFQSPQPEDIDIDHIAWSLSMLCRFNGVVRDFYSVAQHSVIVAQIVESQAPGDNAMILKALLHDAPEAYLGDTVTSVKRCLPGFSQMEAVIDVAVSRRFSIPTEMPSIIHDADMIALVTEARDLHDNFKLGPELTDKYAPLAFTIAPVDHEEAYEMFLDKYFQLRGI